MLRCSGSPPCSPPSSRTRAVGQPPSMWGGLIRCWMRLHPPSATSSPPLQFLRALGGAGSALPGQERCVPGTEDDPLAWLGVKEAPRCSTSHCVGKKKRTCCPAAAFSGGTIAKNCFFPPSHQLHKSLQRSGRCQEWVSVEGLKHEDPKLVQGCVNRSCSCQ